MTIAFRLDCLDGVLAKRMSAEEWQRILVLRDHPHFLDGLFRYQALMPTYFANNLILNRVVTEAWRFEMLVYTLHLHETRDPSDPRTGLTVGRLQAICAQQGIASAGRVTAILGIMQLGGYVVRRRSVLDSRIIHLEPSPGFLAIVEGWNRTICRIIDAISPKDGLAASHAADPRFGREMRRRGAEVLLEGWKLLDPFPEAAHFICRDGGWMLLLHCVASALAPSCGRMIDATSINLGAFGKSFGVSRTHLRRLLETAHAAGLLLEPPRNGTHIVLAPALVAAFLACMASELGYYRAWAIAAQPELTALTHAREIM